MASQGLWRSAVFERAIAASGCCSYRPGARARCSLVRSPHLPHAQHDGDGVPRATQRPRCRRSSAAEAPRARAHEKEQRRSREGRDDREAPQHHREARRARVDAQDVQRRSREGRHFSSFDLPRQGNEPHHQDSAGQLANSTPLREFHASSVNSARFSWVLSFTVNSTLFG